MTQIDHPTEIEQFLARLAQEEAAAKTVANYKSDLSLFARWFRDTTGEEFAAAAVTPTDLRDYRSYLLTTKQSSPATVQTSPKSPSKGWGTSVADRTQRREP